MNREVQSQERESQPNGTIHSIWMEPAMQSVFAGGFNVSGSWDPLLK